MSFEIEKTSRIKKYELDERNYFESLIQVALEKELIDNEFVSNLQLQMLELLKNIIDKYNNFESSSIETDKAKVIMESNIYIIGLYLKKFVPDEAINCLKKNLFIDVYSDAKKFMDEEISRTRLLHDKVLGNLLRTRNEVYNSTNIFGIRGFFKIYDPDYNAKDIKITEDYPLYINLIGKLDGIEFIQKYLECIYLENEYCKMFSKDTIDRLLYRYSADYKNLIINIFRVVLIESIGCVLADENFRELSISDEGRDRIYNLFNKKSKDEIYSILYNAYLKLGISDEKLFFYIESGIDDLMSEIYHSYKLKNLDKIFI